MSRFIAALPALPALVMTALAMTALVVTGLVMAGPATAAPAGEVCATAPHASWSAEEKWIWSERLCVGQNANLAEMPGCETAPKAGQAGNWPACRTVSARFLRRMLLSEPWRNALPDNGAVIENAHFIDRVDLSHGEIERRLLLRFSRFENGLDLSHATTRLVALGGSVFAGRVDLSRAVLKDNLFARNGSFTAVILTGADIDGDADFEASRASDFIDLTGGTVQGNLFLTRGAYANIQASRSDIQGNVFLDGSRIADQAQFDGARIDGRFSTAGNAVVGNTLSLSAARIAQSLDLGGGDFAAIEAPNLEVGDALRMGDLRQGRVTWHGDGWLNLRNARAGGLEDRPDSWGGLRRFDLSGFDYARLGRLQAPDEPGGIGLRPDAWYIDWLSRSVGPSPQPYEQLARELRQQGRPDTAREMMYAARERALAREESVGGVLWGWCKKIVIGHGYRLEYALYLSLALIALGIAVAPRGYRDIRLSWKLRVFFSITMFIPFLEINKRAALERLDDSRAIFFYFIILSGVAIPAMVAAALLGAIG